MSAARKSGKKRQRSRSAQRAFVPTQIEGEPIPSPVDIAGEHHNLAPSTMLGQLASFAHEGLSCTITIGSMTGTVKVTR